MLAENRDKARRRVEAGVHAYIGGNGEGKSLALVHDLLSLLADGVPVLGTVRLLDLDNPRPCKGCDLAGHERGEADGSVTVHRAAHPLWTPLRSWDQLLDWSDGAVALDEVQGVASAREHMGLPYQAANYLRKLRHYDVPLLWTAPDWMAADAVIRRVTRAVTVCRGRIGRDHYKPCRFCTRVHRRADEQCDRASARRLWRDNRLFLWTTYDATNFDEWTQGKKKQEKSICRQAFWRPGHRVENAYDTYAEVLSLGAADQAGVCIACGGVKKRKPCRCEDNETPAGIGLRDFERQGGSSSTT